MAGHGVAGRNAWRRAGGVACLALAGAFPAAAQQPGPAPIVVSGGSGQPIRVRQGGQERVVDPATTRRIGTARSAAPDSAFGAPEAPPEGTVPPLGEWPAEAPGEQVDEQVGEVPLDGGVPPDEAVPEGAVVIVEEPFARGYSSSSRLNERMGRGSLVVDRTVGYQPSSRLNERMPTQGVTALARGYQPSSSLSERMVAGAVATTTSAWGVGDATDVRTMQQWSERGARSLGESP